MKDTDGLAIARLAVDEGVSQWNVMSGDLEQFYARLAAQITELNAASPWGGGTEGIAFHQSYIRDGGPDATLSKGADTVRQIVDVGPRLRQTFENSLGTDAAHARDLSRGTVRSI
jgi:hypothetical protein